MESKEQIQKHLNTYNAEGIIMLYGLLTKVILGNNDFRIAAYANEDDLRPIIEDETGVKIDFPMESIIGEDSLAIWKKIESYDTTDKKLKKAKRVELIASVLSDDTLFEGFLLAFYEVDEVGILCADYGCAKRYQQVVNDPVYCKRKKYMQLISTYANAAVNLYGVIHLKELQEIIKGYEHQLNDYTGYARQSGTYQNSVIYNPRYFGICTLQHLIGDNVLSVISTLDGNIIHLCFRDDYIKEQGEMMNYFASKKREITPNDFEDFFLSTMEKSPYRMLQMDAAEKPFYLPDKKEFLRYADEYYYETTPAEKELRRYINKKYRSNFAQVARTVGISTDECIDDFLEELHDEVTDVGKCSFERDPQELAEFIFHTMEGYDITYNSIDAANELLGYAMKIANSVRLWSNHGNTPMELVSQMPKDGLTIVPGSTQMAETLGEGRQELERMGMHIDLDSNATNIPTLAFSNGIKGEGQPGVKKVYPNDPCPCGSGRKYKKCCGK